MVVFDLDGTLIDSIGDLVVAVNRLVAERGGRALHRDEVSRMAGEGAGLLISRAFGASGVAEGAAEALPRFLEIYDAILPGATRPYPGVPEMLEAVRGVGPIAVLTNKPAGAAKKILSMLDLDRHVDSVVGGDGPLRRKPSPDALLRLIAGAGTDPGAAWMVGDSTVDLLTAQAAGTRACIARYRFGFATFDHARLRGGEVFADHPAAITALLVEERRGN